jgi:hypothetical protein
MISSRSSGETLSEKLYFFGNNSIILFRIFFPPQRFISETYFFTIERFQKAANKLGDLNTSYQRFSKTFLCVRSRFPKQFHNSSRGFPTWCLANQNIQKPWKAANKFINIF